MAEDSEGETDYLANELNGLEISDLGDLSDVPQTYLLEVVELLRSLPGPADYPGDQSTLRIWIQALSRTASFSRVATVELLKTVAQCMEATRPKGQTPSRDSLQQAFVRMGGLRETVNIMLMRLNDAAVVAQSARTLAACVQGSPRAAEAVFDYGTNNLKTMLRAVERHCEDFSVAESACMLISHLCSLTSQPGAEAAPVRLTTHREVQSLLSGVGGSIDIMVHMLTMHVEKVKNEAAKADRLHAKFMDTENEAPPKNGAKSKVALSIERAKRQIEVKQAWVKSNTVEATGGRIQELALQALLLMIFGNPDNLRQFAGELWIWGNARQSEEQAAVVAKLLVAAAKPKPAPHARRSARRSISKQRPSIQENASSTDEYGLPKGEERWSLATLDGFAKVSMLLLEILRGRAARDRPGLAAKACRILSLIVDHCIGLLRNVELGRREQNVEIAAALCPGPVPADNRKPKAPFAPLVPVIAALTFAMRTHKSNCELLAEAGTVLMKLKTLALLSSPAGVETQGEELLYEWQHLLAGAEKGEEMESASKVLKRALEATDLAHQRMKHVGGNPDQFTGECDAVFLTPRMRESVAQSALKIDELAGDAIASRWRNGEPGRRNRKHGDASEEVGGSRWASTRSSLRSREDSRSGRSSRSGSQALSRHKPGPSKHRPAKLSVYVDTPDVLTPAVSTLPSPAAGSSASPDKEALIEITDQKPKAAAKQKHSDAAKTEPQVNVSSLVLEKEKRAKENVEPSEWKRAIGFDTHDEVDFKRVWLDPLHAAVKRSISMPAIKQQKADKRRESTALSDAFTSARMSERRTVPVAPQTPRSSDLVEPDERMLNQDAEAEFAPSSLRVEEVESPELEFVSSVPGLLQTRLLLPSLDDSQFKATEAKLKKLTDHNVANEVTTEVTKHLRREGFLLPEYGVDVRFMRGKRPSSRLHAPDSSSTLLQDSRHQG